MDIICAGAKGALWFNRWYELTAGGNVDLLAVEDLPFRNAALRGYENSENRMESARQQNCLSHRDSHWNGDNTGSDRLTMDIALDDGDFLRKSLGGGYRIVGLGGEARLAVCRRCRSDGGDRIRVDGPNIRRHDNQGDPYRYRRAPGVGLGSFPLLALGMETQ